MSNPSDTTQPEKSGSPAATPETESNGGAVVILFFIFGLAASMVLGWVIFPTLLYSKKKQPVDFNHVLHVAEVENGCQSCHFLREDGTFSGRPTLESCVTCHESVLGVTEEEAHFVSQYVEKNREVPWLVYSEQPDCVFFSHAAHIINAKMDCVTCHGHIGESEHLPFYEENRITGYSRNIWGKNIAGIARNTWDRMKMDACADCHIRENVRQSSIQTEKGGCFVCHK